ncbi:mediator of RNA polymerase II transcription subunit 15a-like [Carex rostrata]
MDSNWNTAQSGFATGSSFGVGPDSNTIDWRSQMQPDARQRVVNKMVETLKSHLPVLVPERLIELQKIAVRFEELIYSFSTSQPDYLKRIALKMLSIERKTQPGLNPSLPNQNQIDPGVGLLQVMNRTTASRQHQPLLQGLPNIPQQSQPMIQNSTTCMQQTNNVIDLQQQRLQMQKNQMQKNQLQPNQMQHNQMLNQQMILDQQQNLFLASGGANNIDNMQRKMKMQRNAGQQQQQHLLSELQSQQQQLPQQQQPSMIQMPQQWMQGFPSLLQTQNGNAIDPQRQQQQQFISQQQLQQQQRVVQNVASSTASMDSAASTGNQEDWQEEIYQRITYLKDTYFTDLREVHQKLSIKLSQLDSVVPPNARGEQIEKMKHYKMVLECMMAGLQLSKNSVQIGLKDKLSVYEEQIVSILQNHKKAPQQQPQAGAPSDQLHFPALQQSQPGLQSQEPPQQQQPQQMDNQNQLQQQLSIGAMTQPNNLHMPNAMQQGMQNTLHSDQLQASGMGFGSLQQGSMGPTMRSTMNPPQMVGSGAAISSSIMSHTVTIAGMQTNMSFTQVLKPQQQQQEQQIQPQQHMVQTQQQTQQHYLQQRLMQKQKQMQQLSEPSDLADLKPKEGAAGMKPGSMFQQYYPGMGPRNGYYHSQLKSGYNPPISSPQNIHSSSPQISHPSPQVDQQGLIPPTQLKSGTPLQTSASPFVPSPSPPVVPSPMIKDTELGAGLMHNSATGQTGQPLSANTAQTGQMGQPQAESLAVGTPGISANPMPAEFISPEAGQGTILSIQVPESETPIQKLARLMRTMPQSQLNAAVKDIASVVNMVDRIPGSALGNGSQAAIDDDLVVMTKCRLQAKNLAHPEGVGGTSGRASSPTKKRKRDSIARKVIQEYADQFGGGSFFSRIIKWQAVNPADPYVIV